MVVARVSSRPSLRRKHVLKQRKAHRRRNYYERRQRVFLRLSRRRRRFQTRRRRTYNRFQLRNYPHYTPLQPRLSTRRVAKRRRLGFVFKCAITTFGNDVSHQSMLEGVTRHLWDHRGAVFFSNVVSPRTDALLDNIQHYVTAIILGGGVSLNIAPQSLLINPSVLARYTHALHGTVLQSSQTMFMYLAPNRQPQLGSRVAPTSPDGLLLQPLAPNFKRLRRRYRSLRRRYRSSKVRLLRW